MTKQTNLSNFVPTELRHLNKFEDKLILFRRNRAILKTMITVSFILKDDFNIITKAIFNIKENGQRHKFTKESLTKSILFKWICGIKTTTSLRAVLLTEPTISGNLGFSKEIPSFLTLRNSQESLLKIDHIEVIMFRIIRKINKVIEQRKWTQQ